MATTQTNQAIQNQQQRKEIMWNIINSLLAGTLVFVGAFSTGHIDKTAILVAISTSLVIAISKFRDYWISEQSEYNKAFNLI